MRELYDGRQKREIGYTLIELLVVVCTVVVIMLALASVIDVAWLYYKHMNRFNRVDNQLRVVDNYFNRGIRNSVGGFYWMPVGSLDMLYLYNYMNAVTIAVEGVKVEGGGSWVKVEDAALFAYAMMDNNKYVNVVGANGLRVALLKEVDIGGGRLSVRAVNTEGFWINRGDVIEGSRKFRYAEMRKGKMWIEGYGNVADGIIAFDFMYELGGRVGYGIVQMTEPTDALVICNYDADGDGSLTVEDDLDADGVLDCMETEGMEPQKFDAVVYWVLAALPEKENVERKSLEETFVVGRKIYRLPRSRYPRLIIRRINLRGFEI